MIKGFLAKKQYMTQLFDEETREVIPCTILDLDGCVVAGFKTEEKDGYTAVMLGIGKKRKPTKPEIGKFKSLGYVPSKIREFRVNSTEGYEIGKKLDLSDLESGTAIKVRGISKGKGFAGVVKRWNFAGGPKTHGQSDRHRAPGSIGAGTTPGRVLKGKKMAGRMGNEKVMMKSKIVLVDMENGYIVVKGSVPGARNSLQIVTM